MYIYIYIYYENVTFIGRRPKKGATTPTPKRDLILFINSKSFLCNSIVNLTETDQPKFEFLSLLIFGWLAGEAQPSPAQ